jgi:putative addiction module component (TIGR02574 family)
MPQVAAADLFSLSIPERIQLVEDIWDSIAVHPEMVGLTPDIKGELDIRLAEHEQHPDDVSSWDEVRSRLWRTL